MNGLRILARGPGNKQTWLVETDDGAQLAVDTAGQGRPLVLVHGWAMSRLFWRRQVEDLSSHFRTIVMDLRAHGDSSKTTYGHTVPRYARDVRAVIEALDVKEAVLAGWSLGGPVVLDYWSRYGADRISGLALVEMTPSPMSPEPWNTHARRGYDFDGLNGVLQELEEDRVSFGGRFIHDMFHQGSAEAADFTWMMTEYLKTPTVAAMAGYSDYVLRDYTDVLESVSVPTLVMNGQSPYLCFGPTTGRFVAETIPHSDLILFEKSGHLPFYEEPVRFNEALSDFSKTL